jgi:predicted Holliday junction resolvase-like endonuclease
MINDTVDLIFLVAILIIVIAVFIRIAIKIRKYGGSMTTTMFAATFEFLNKDKRNAVNEIVETKAHKKKWEERSDKPKDE